MNRIFRPGDIVIAEIAGTRCFPARVESNADSADLHHVTPLSTIYNERPSHRFIPWWRLNHALWTFTGFVEKPYDKRKR